MTSSTKCILHDRPMNACHVCSGSRYRNSYQATVDAVWTRRTRAPRAGSPRPRAGGAERWGDGVAGICVLDTCLAALLFLQRFSTES